MGCLSLPTANLPGKLEVPRAARPPTPSRGRRRPRGAASGLTLRAPGRNGASRAGAAPAVAGQHEGPTLRLPGLRPPPRPTYLQRLLLRPRPGRPPWWSPGPAFSRPPSPWRADGSGAGRGGGGAARAGGRERAEARPARRGPQRTLASAGRKQHYGNMAAPRCTPGGRRMEKPDGGGQTPKVPGA